MVFTLLLDTRAVKNTVGQYLRLETYLVPCVEANVLTCLMH